LLTSETAVANAVKLNSCACFTLKPSADYESTRILGMVRLRRERTIPDWSHSKGYMQRVMAARSMGNGARIDLGIKSQKARACRATEPIHYLGADALNQVPGGSLD